MGLKTKLVAYLLTFGMGYTAGTVYAPAPKMPYVAPQNQAQSQTYNSGAGPAGTGTLEERAQENERRVEARQKLLELMK